MKYILICYSLLNCYLAIGQSTLNGWFFSSHKQKLPGKWSLFSDIQFRSSDNLHYLQTTLLRPGISYNITENQEITAGYAYLYNKSKENATVSYEYENRIWEQLKLDAKLEKTEVSNRFRLEQRFLNGDERNFSQRFRYYLRFQVPVFTNDKFTNGWYAGLQNEIFLNIQNKKAVNNSLFDQNRSGISWGYRFSEKADVELAYLFRYQLEENSKNSNHIIQLAVYTSL